MSVFIVGAGVFGQVIANKLRRTGHQVMVFDRREKEAGSPPSGGHLKPSWLTAIPRDDLDKSLETLDALYGLEKLECQFGIPPLTKRMELLRVDIDRVLSSGRVCESNITAVGDGWVESDRVRFDGTVIVAAGVWSAELLPQFKHYLSAKKGMSFTFSGETSNIIRPWAPYKQIVRTSHGPGRIWIGDGSAIIPQNWDDQRERQIRGRVFEHVPATHHDLVVRRGLRPYMHNGLQQVSPRLWLATGGAKSGMALAGVYANKLAEALC